MFKELSKITQYFCEEFGESFVIATRATETQLIVEVIVYVEHEGAKYQFSALLNLKHGAEIDDPMKWAGDAANTIHEQIITKFKDM